MNIFRAGATDTGSQRTYLEVAVGNTSNNHYFGNVRFEVIKMWLERWRPAGHWLPCDR